MTLLARPSAYLAIALLRRWHGPNVAAALRTNAGRPYRAVHLVLTVPHP